MPVAPLPALPDNPPLPPVTPVPPLPPAPPLAELPPLPASVLLELDESSLLHAMASSAKETAARRSLALCIAGA